MSTYTYIHQIYLYKMCIRFIRYGHCMKHGDLSDVDLPSRDEERHAVDVT